MNIKRMIGNCFGLGLLRKGRLETLVRDRRERYRARLAEAARNQTRMIARIKNFPKLPMSRQEFDSLPKGKEVDLYGCPLGTRFVCSPYAPLPDAVVIGHVVGRDDLLCSQLGGAAFSVPERGINRYNLELV